MTSPSNVFKLMHVHTHAHFILHTHVHTCTHTHVHTCTHTNKRRSDKLVALLVVLLLYQQYSCPMNQSGIMMIACLCKTRGGTMFDDRSWTLHGSFGKSAYIHILLDELWCTIRQYSCVVTYIVGTIHV